MACQNEVLGEEKQNVKRKWKNRYSTYLLKYTWNISGRKHKKLLILFIIMSNWGTEVRGKYFIGYFFVPLEFWTIWISFFFNGKETKEKQEFQTSKPLMLGPSSDPE